MAAAAETVARLPRFLFSFERCSNKAVNATFFRVLFSFFFSPMHLVVSMTAVSVQYVGPFAISCVFCLWWPSMASFFFHFWPLGSGTMPRIRRASRPLFFLLCPVGPFGRCLYKKRERTRAHCAAGPSLAHCAQKGVNWPVCRSALPPCFYVGKRSTTMCSCGIVHRHRQRVATNCNHSCCRPFFF